MSRICLEYKSISVCDRVGCRLGRSFWVPATDSIVPRTRCSVRLFQNRGDHGTHLMLHIRQTWRWRALA
jgi:hypothetical protein